MFDLFNIHPLVLLNVSDQIKRSRYRNAADHPILGIILGESACAMDSLDIHVSGDSIDSELLKTRLSLMAEIHPKLELIGLYTATTLSDEALFSISQRMELSEFYLLTIQEASLTVDHCRRVDACLTRNRTPHTIRATDPAIIALRDVSNTSKSLDLSKKTAEDFGNFGNAYATLLSKLAILRNYVDRVAGGLAPDEAILLEISSLMQEFSEELIESDAEEEAARAVINLAEATQLLKPKDLKKK